MRKIVPGANNEVAIDLICTHIRQKFEERANRFRQKIAVPHLYMPSKTGATTPESRLEDLDLSILPQTPQIQGIFTILRDRTTPRQDFVFFADRLATLLAEHALSFMPFVPRSIQTPTGADYHGQKSNVEVCLSQPTVCNITNGGHQFLCGVSIMRSCVC